MDGFLSPVKQDRVSPAPLQYPAAPFCYTIQAEEGGDLFGGASLAQPQQGGEAVVQACAFLLAAEFFELLLRQSIQSEAGRRGGHGAFKPFPWPKLLLL